MSGSRFLWGAILAESGWVERPRHSAAWKGGGSLERLTPRQNLTRFFSLSAFLRSKANFG